jgi:phosphatidylserine decarboxylase
MKLVIVASLLGGAAGFAPAQNSALTSVATNMAFKVERGAQDPRLPWVKKVGVSTKLSAACHKDSEKLTILPPGPPEPEPWDATEAAALLQSFTDMQTTEDGKMSITSAALRDCLAEVCNPVLTPSANRRAFWLQYRNEENDKNLTDFFRKWLTYTPVPDNDTKDPNEPNGPGFYIEKWDWLANSEAGLKLNNEDETFKAWFAKFLDLHGKWIDSPESNTTIDLWMNFKSEGMHPFDINEFIVPEGGYKTFNQFFLRMAKKRPLDDADDKLAIVSPCDGGVFYLTEAHTPGEVYELPDKSADQFNIAEAFPGYGAAFVGGPLLDTLLWFTDYHHFSAPVSGKVLHVGDYKGSYNYDFDSFDPKDPYAPAPLGTSDRVGWYENLDKHRRLVWIIQTEDIGIVAMAAVGFWGVGSIVNYVEEGHILQKGEYMGHFNYGASSIVLALEPNIDFQFVVDGCALSGPAWPRAVKAKQHLGRANGI